MHLRALACFEAGTHNIFPLILETVYMILLKSFQDSASRSEHAPALSFEWLIKVTPARLPMPYWKGLNRVWSISQNLRRDPRFPRVCHKCNVEDSKLRFYSAVVGRPLESVECVNCYTYRRLNDGKARPLALEEARCGGGRPIPADGLCEAEHCAKVIHNEDSKPIFSASSKMWLCKDCREERHNFVVVRAAAGKQAAFEARKQLFAPDITDDVEVMQRIKAGLAAGLDPYRPASKAKSKDPPCDSRSTTDPSQNGERPKRPLPDIPAPTQSASKRPRLNKADEFNPIKAELRDRKESDRVAEQGRRTAEKKAEKMAEGFCVREEKAQHPAETLAGAERVKSERARAVAEEKVLRGERRQHRIKMDALQTESDRAAARALRFAEKAAEAERAQAERARVAEGKAKIAEEKAAKKARKEEEKKGKRKRPGKGVHGDEGNYEEMARLQAELFAQHGSGK
ncbi:hypothetical protein B9Z65_366 [Elsinoe australis]|uniref:Uncharacterized protein n=1 Tax=Elsinoe australis TaxID=40998 RepID=A0A2P7ZQD6_9PEZI|nr:hypothetical protein B9Z65_366 [Elsinoe australis]